MRHLLPWLLMLLSCISALAQDDAAVTALPPEMLEGKSLKLPVGTIAPPRPGWEWRAAAGAYVAMPLQDDDPNMVVCVYMPMSMSASKSDIEMMIRSEMMDGTPEQIKKAPLEIKESGRPVFGTMFDFDFTDADGPSSGSICVASAHSLLLCANGPAARALARETLGGFEPSKLALKATTVSSDGFLDKTQSVPPRLLKGRRLSLPGGSIQAPKGWTWRQLESEGITLYFCYEKPSRLILVVNSLQKEDLRAAVRELSKSLVSRGSGSLEEKSDFAPASLPFPGSEKITLSYSMAGEPFIEVNGYAGYNGRQSLMVLELGDKPTDKILDEVVGSFKEEMPSRQRLDTALGVLTLALGLVLVLLGAIINKVVGRPAFDGAKVALAVSGLAMVFCLMAAANRDPQDMGHAVGSFFLPMLLFGWLSSKHTKRREAWRAESRG